MICTFYSYKGGVGRSMAMANVADILARRGLSVLMVDFDLEAPGLEQFFRINHDGVRRSRGLLDLLLDYKTSMSMGGRGDTRFRDVSRYIVPVFPSLGGGGRLDLLPAGQRHDAEQLARYALNLRTFDWQDFYYHWQGERFFEWLRRALTPSPYDLVLVDSRTGVTEMGGICGYQLADTIVMLCAANHQNVDGTASMLRDFRSPAVEALRRDRALDIVVVPARIEQGDLDLLEAFFGRFEEAFSDLVPEGLAGREIGFRDLTIPYEPLYAFEEQVVSDPGQAGLRAHIGAAFELLADAVALLAAPKGYRREAAPEAEGLAPSPSPAPAQYDAAKRFADFDVFLSVSGGTAAAQLVSLLGERGLRVFNDGGLLAGTDWQAVLEESLFHSKVLVLGLGRDGAGEYHKHLLELAGRTSARGEAMPVVPVLLPGATTEALMELGLQRFQAVDLRRAGDEAAFERLHRAVRACLEPAPAVEASSRAPYAGSLARTEQDADLFFGRERLVSEIAEAIAARPVVSLLGPSGSGKTSLVGAGVIPRLRAGATEEVWGVLRVRCRCLPVDGQLAVRFQHRGQDVDLTLSGLEERIADADRSRLLLVLDDLEALTGAPAWQEEAAALARMLERAGRDVDLHVLVVARSDAVPELREVPAIAALLDAHPLRMESMDEAELRRAIEGPVQRVGATFEPGLVDRILTEMQGDPEALALMQGLLQELWIRRRDGWLTNQAFDALGGIAGVAARRAEAVYQRLTPPEREAIRHLMMGLVRTDPTGEHRSRRMPMSALVPRSGDDDGYRALAEQLVAEHLLIARATDSGRRAVELAHEGLISDWPRLRGWLAENRDFLTWRDRLADAANAWDQAGRPGNLLLRGGDLARARDWREEHAADLSALQEIYLRRSTARRNRATMVSVAVLTVVALVTTGFAVLAWQQRENALAQQTLAEKRLRQAESAQATAELLRETESAARRAAEDRGEQLETEVRSLQRSVEETSRYVAELEQRSEQLADRAQIAEIEEQRAAWESRAREAQESEARLREALEKLRTEVVQAAPQPSSDVYVHYSLADQRTDVVRLARTLQAEGIRVPSLELTEPVKTSQLRYFSKDRETVDQARWLVKLLKSKQGVQDLVARYVRPGKKGVPAGRYELWLSGAFGTRAR